MSDDVVLYESTDHIATITINRPDKMNALSEQVVVELRNAFNRLEESDDRVAILTSAGTKAFSVGADLKDPPIDPDLWEGVPNVGRDLDKPVIAAVAGYCVGGAYVLVQHCDLAVAADNADFFYPEAQVGFCGGLISGAAARLPHKIAMEFMLTGAHFDAQYATILRDSSPMVIAMLKRFVRDTVTPRGPSEEQAVARRDLLAIKRSEDQREGARAFAEKRKPIFRGR